MTENEALAQFVRTGSQEAFARVVAAHVDLVYAAARRQVRDAQLAEDVTQAVFIVLMRRAKTLRPEVPIVGWLLKTTYFASRDAMKMEARRRRHEQKAASMKKPFIETTEMDISPDLDGALARLGEMDRSVVALRFMEDKSVIEIAEALSISREAAAKRLTRAVGKLRRILMRRQHISAAIPMETLLAAVPRLTAPPHLAGAAISAATSSSATNSALIAKGAIKMMIWSHAKAAIVFIAGTVAIGTIAVGTHSLVRGDAAPATPIAQPTSAAHRYIGQVSNGPSIQILGIAEHDDATGQPVQWWAADGSPMDFGPYAQMDKVAIASYRFGDIQREVAVGINDNIRGTTEKASVHWYFVGTGTSVSSTPKDEHGKTVSNVDGMVIELPDDPNGATLHFAVASGPWTTHIITRPDSNSAMSEGDNSVLTSEGFEVRGRTHVIVTMASSKSLPDQAERLIGMTTSGKTIEAYFASQSATGSARIMEMVIPAPLQSIKQLRFQTRPWNQWVEIRNISLHPGKNTNVQIVSSDQGGAQPIGR